MTFQIMIWPHTHCHPNIQYYSSKQICKIEGNKLWTQRYTYADLILRSDIKNSLFG